MQTLRHLRGETGNRGICGVFREKAYDSFIGQRKTTGPFNIRLKILEREPTLDFISQVVNCYSK